MEATLHQNNKNDYTMVNHEGHIFSLKVSYQRDPLTKASKGFILVSYIGKSNGYIATGIRLREIPELLKRTFFSLNRKNILQYIK